MIQPTNADVGRRVTYNPHASPGAAPRQPEHGVITSLGVRPGYCFVRYDRQPADHSGQLTPCERLSWAD